MSLLTLAEWLRCPNCSLPLSQLGELTLGCPSGHAFDVNKRGYVNLLTGPGKFIGDSATMLDARDRFLAAGWYEPLRKATAGVIAAEMPARILDVGCGTGYYLGAALRAAQGARAARVGGSDVRALAMDLSPTAVARTARTHARVDGLVADVWSPLPIRDGAADVILNVFAPRNAAEFHRVLTMGGLLVVAVPRANHLKQLREAGLALEVQADKTTHLMTSLASWFSVEAALPLECDLQLAPSEVAALVGMGPSSHHKDGRVPGHDVGTAMNVTAAFDVCSFRRRD